MRELQVGMGVAAEKGDKLSPFSGGNAPSRYVALLHGVGEKTVRMRAMRRRETTVYRDSVVGVDSGTARRSLHFHRRVN